MGQIERLYTSTLDQGSFKRGHFQKKNSISSRRLRTSKADGIQIGFNLKPEIHGPRIPQKKSIIAKASSPSIPDLK